MIGPFYATCLLAALVLVLAGMSLIRVEVDARSRSYAVLEAGREAALDHEGPQIDLEEWLAAAP